MSDGPNAKSGSSLGAAAEQERNDDDLRGHPRPGRLARIADPTRITAEVAVSLMDVHRYLTRFMAQAGHVDVPTYGTIGRILKGNTGSYENVNWVFTAINIRYRSFSRRDLVFVSSRRGEMPCPDDNLSYALVFPRLPEIMDAANLTDPGLSGLAYTTGQEELALIGVSNLPADARKPVRSVYINRMKAGYPVRQDKVLAVIRALNEHLNQKLDAQVETCR